VKRHSFKPHAFHFQLNYECDVIFAVPQICAYFVDNPHNLEIDSFKIAVSEHILLYFKNSNSFFLCTHDDVRHTLCQTVMTRGVLSFSRGKLSTYFHRMCIHSHFKIKSSSHAVRNIIPSNNGLGVERMSFSWLLDSTCLC
jgi:hypothetical protein